MDGRVPPPQAFNGDRFGIPRVDQLGQFVRWEAGHIQIHDARDDNYVVIPRDSVVVGHLRGEG